MIKWLLFIFKKKVAPATPVVQAPKATPATQFMITKKMRNELANLGWTKSKVDAMHPQVAASIIENQQTPNR